MPRSPKSARIDKASSVAELATLLPRIGICGIFKARSGLYLRLWDLVDVPDKVTATSSKWGQRMDTIWRWKNELPAMYPDEIFYGKMPNGDAVLMSVEHLRTKHHPTHARRLEACRPLARELFALIAAEPGIATGELRRLAVERTRCTKPRFATALAELQIALLVARAPDSPVQTDHWLRFADLFPRIATTSR